ncbi:2-hydroxychromene-2-carboxylate isomerase [Roseobacter sp. HKCCA0882]|jgi:2-hydroxychromene-2-carboxylate isomerase|uniref:2-hydroxychromene-2-carboxylate isomerase n=1 Tax=Roseobacter sp. HKCCA0882 TaxID=3120337 RepID=UPI0030EF8173
MSHIDYYFSTISPYTYLAGKRLEEIAAAHGATIRYRPLDIIALFARTGGTPPAERHPARQAYRLQELQRQSKKTGLALTLKPAFFPTNSAPSSYAIIAAQNEGGGDLAELVHGVTRAVWREEKNIAEDDVIRAALTAAGFDPSLADRGLLSGAEEYAANLEAAVEAGVFGAPFYLVDGVTHFWGQDRLDDLALHLEGKL